MHFIAINEFKILLSILNTIKENLIYQTLPDL